MYIIYIYIYIYIWSINKWSNRRAIHEHIVAATFCSKKSPSVLLVHERQTLLK